MKLFRSRLWILALALTGAIGIGVQAQLVDGAEESVVIQRGKTIDVMAYTTLSSPSFSWTLTKEGLFVKSQRSNIFTEVLTDDGTYLLVADAYNTSKEYHREVTLTLSDAQHQGVRLSPAPASDGSIALGTSQILSIVAAGDDIARIDVDLDLNVDADGDGNKSNDVDIENTALAQGNGQLLIWLPSLEQAQSIGLKVVYNDTSFDEAKYVLVGAADAGENVTNTAEANIETTDDLVAIDIVGFSGTDDEADDSIGIVETMVEQSESASDSSTEEPVSDTDSVITILSSDGSSLLFLLNDQEILDNPHTIFHWDFGDGTSSIDAIPEQTFADGLYSITLTVQDLLSGETLLSETQDVTIPYADVVPEVVLEGTKKALWGTQTDDDTDTGDETGSKTPPVEDDTNTEDTTDPEETEAPTEENTDTTDEGATGSAEDANDTGMLSTLLSFLSWNTLFFILKLIGGVLFLISLLGIVAKLIKRGKPLSERLEEMEQKIVDTPPASADVVDATPSSDDDGLVGFGEAQPAPEYVPQETPVEEPEFQAPPEPQEPVVDTVPTPPPPADAPAPAWLQNAAETVPPPQEQTPLTPTPTPTPTPNPNPPPPTVSLGATVAEQSGPPLTQTADATPIGKQDPAFAQQQPPPQQQTPPPPPPPQQPPATPPAEPQQPQGELPPWLQQN